MIHFDRSWYTSFGITMIMVLLPSEMISLYIVFSSTSLSAAAGYIVLGMMALGLITVVLATLKQSVQLTDEHLMVRLGMFRRKAIPLQDITSIKSLNYPVERKYGWGLNDKKTFEQPITLYNFLGKEGVVLTTTSGEHLFVGARESEHLATAVEQIKR